MTGSGAKKSTQLQIDRLFEQTVATVTSILAPARGLAFLPWHTRYAFHSIDLPTAGADRNELLTSSLSDVFYELKINEFTTQSMSVVLW